MFAGAISSETSDSATSGFSPALPPEGAVLCATQPGANGLTPQAGARAGRGSDTGPGSQAASIVANGCRARSRSRPGRRLPGPGVLLRTRQALKSRSYDRLRLSHSRSVLALAIMASRVSSLARTHVRLIPEAVSAGGVACSGMEAGHVVRLASAALRAATERAAISRALAAVKRIG